MLFKFFKKKKVPPTLPDLAIDSLNKSEYDKTSEPKLVNNDNVKIENHTSIDNEVPEVEYNTLPLKRKFPGGYSESNEKMIKEVIESDNETGFFKDLLKDITQEMKSVEKLDNWYKTNLQEEDMINQMREYWERQKPALIMRNVSGELVEKLKEKTNKLHEMEKEWQDIYFELLSKEEKIREEEKELKKELSEFIELCKKRMNKNKKSR